MEGIEDADLDRLLHDLAQAGAGDMALQADDRPDNAQHLVRLCLQGAREEGLGFDEAWKMGMARLQPSQAGGTVDAAQAAALREDRQLLEEDRPLFRAAYEGRSPTTIERAQRLAAVSGRLDSALRVTVPARAA